MKTYLVSRGYMGNVLNQDYPLYIHVQLEIEAETEAEATELFEEAERKLSTEVVLDMLVPDTHIEMEE